MTTTTRRLSILIVTSALAMCGAAPNDGGGPPPSTGDEEGSLAATLTGDAKSLYDIGRQAFQSNDPATALPRFQRAHELSQDPRLLWNMAACEAALKHWARASALVDRYLTTGGALLSDKDKERATRFRAAAKALVASIDLTGATPAGVTVTVDGEPIGTTPLHGPLYLDAGRRRVQFTKPGHRGIVRIETVSGGSDLTWVISLERLRVRPLGSGS